jgi:hypothetical protein
MAERQNDAIAALNKRNREFWRARDVLLQPLLPDETIVAAALATLESAPQRRRSVKDRMSFEDALTMAAEVVAQIRPRFLSQQGRSGGRAKKSDALQELIVGVVRARPAITCAELLAELRDRCPIPPLEGIEKKTISFVNRDGRGAEAKICGLKDRLSRAKKKIRSNR